MPTSGNDGTRSDGNGEEKTNGNNEDYEYEYYDVFDDCGEQKYDDNFVNQRAHGLSNGMEAGATTGDTAVVAPASMPPRDSFSAGIDSRTRNESSAPASLPLENESQSQDKFEAATAVVNGVIRMEEPWLSSHDIEIEQPSLDLLGSRRDIDDSSIEDIDVDEILRDFGLDQMPPAPAPGSFDSLNVPMFDAEERETGMTCINSDSNSAVESSNQPAFNYSQRVQFLITFLREHAPLLRVEDVEDLARSMVRSLVDDDGRLVSISRDQMLLYFSRSHGNLYPDTLQPLITWLMSSVQPAAPIAGDGRNGNRSEGKEVKKSGNPSSAKSKKKRKKYRCGICGEIKVKYTKDGYPIPHMCIQNVKKGTDRGTEMGTRLGGNDNDIDGTLQDPPPNSVKYACDSEDGDDGDRKPAAVVRGSASKASSSIPSVRTPRIVGPNRGLVGPTEEEQPFSIAASLSSVQQLKENGCGKTEDKTEEEECVSAEIGESQLELHVQDRSNEDNEVQEYGEAPETAGDERSGNEDVEGFCEDVERYEI